MKNKIIKRTLITALVVGAMGFGSVVMADGVARGNYSSNHFLGQGGSRATGVIGDFRDNDGGGSSWVKGSDGYVYGLNLAIDGRPRVFVLGSAGRFSVIDLSNGGAGATRDPKPGEIAELVAGDFRSEPSGINSSVGGLRDGYKNGDFYPHGGWIFHFHVQPDGRFNDSSAYDNPQQQQQLDDYYDYSQHIAYLLENLSKRVSTLESAKKFEAK